MLRPQVLDLYASFPSERVLGVHLAVSSSI